jgi:BlaI family penicillinase repressor
VKKRSRIVQHKTEWDLLEVLWKRERATAREVAEDLEGTRDWAVSTVKTLLDRMVAKELVEARQVGPVWEYTPGIRRVEARRWAWRELIERAFGGASGQALHFLATNAKLSKKELGELRDLLDRSGKDDD